MVTPPPAGPAGFIPKEAGYLDGLSANARPVSESLDKLRFRLLFGIFGWAVVLPTLGSVSGLYIGGANNFAEAREAGLGWKDTFQAVIDGAANEALRRWAVLSRAGSIFGGVFGPVLGLMLAKEVAAKSSPGRVVQAMVRGASV